MKYSRIIHKGYLLIFIFLLVATASIKAQDHDKAYNITVSLPPVYVYGKFPFKNEKQRMAYNKLVRDVRKHILMLNS